MRARGLLRPPVLRTAETALLGLVVGLLVVGPWIGDGYLLLLDWVSGPTQTLNPGVYGLAAGGLDAMPFRLATQALRWAVGPAATAWLLILAYFPLAAAGASHLVGGSRWRRYPAALLMACNPFVTDRVHAGHVAFLLGVGLLPWLLRSAVRARETGGWVAVRPAGVYALAMAISPHSFWLGGACLAAVALLPRPTWRDVVRTVQVGLSAGLVYAYAVVVLLAGIRTIEVTDADLSAYATRAGPGGLLTTVLSLHGFWRDFEGQVRDQLPLAILAAGLVLLLLLVVLGLTRLVVLQPVLGAPVVAVTVLGLVLGAGIGGPAGTAYRWLFDHAPLFEAMREQQKWLALAVIGYSAGLGAAVEWVVRAMPGHLGALRRARRRALAPTGPARPATAVAGALAVLAAAVPLLSAPALLWGVGGRVRTSEYPQGWYEADQGMGTGDELALFLPWHGYQPFDFTDGRSVATPAEAFFRRPVLSSDAVELGALRTDSISLRTAYVDRLVAAAGGGTSFGRMVAPLGVRYVVWSRQRETERYAWLERQRDLDLVLETPSVWVYRVRPDGIGRVVSARGVLGVPQALTLAADEDLGTEAVLPEPDDPAAADEGPLPSQASGGVRRETEVAWDVTAGPPGWVVVPVEWSPGWRLDGQGGRPTLAGTVAIRAGSDDAQVVYAPWAWLRLGLAVSLLSLIGLLALGLIEHREEVRHLLRRRHARPPGAA